MTRRKVERTLEGELDVEAFDRRYGFGSKRILTTKGKRMAIRVVSQLGEKALKSYGCNKYRLSYVVISEFIEIL